MILMLPHEVRAQFSGPLTLSAGASYEVAPVSYESRIHTPCDCGGSDIMQGHMEGPAGHIGLGFSGTFGLWARLDLASSHTTESFNYTLADAMMLYEGAILPVKQTILLSTRFAMTDARLELLGTYRAPFGVVVALGPYVGYRSVHGFEMTMRLIEPEDARFGSSIGALAIRDNGREALHDDGRYQQMRHLSVGGLFILSYPIALGGGIGIAPEVRGRLDLLPPFVASSWKMRGIGGGLSLSYTLPDPPSADPLPPASGLSLEPGLPLSSAIAIYAMGSGGTRLREAVIRSGITETMRHVVFSPTLRFDEATGLPARYLRLSPAEVGGFDPDSVARLKPGLIDRNIPNVVGARLRGNAMRARLVASVLPGEGAEVALLRATSLRRYLGETWGIGDDRIAIATEPGEAPVVRVVMEKSLELSASWSEPRVETSPVRVEPEVESRSGVKGWSIGLLRDGRELARQSDVDPASRINIGMLLSELREDASRSPLVAELTVEDSSGATSIARDTLPFRFEEGGSAKRVTEYLLLGTPASEDLVENMAASAGVGSHLTITPLSGMSADREAASALASRLGDRGIAARVAAPTGDGEGVEGMRIDIEEEAVARP